MKRLLLLTFLILTAGMLPLWLNFGGPIKGTDFIGQQIPFILETKRMLSSGAPWWSWNTFYGENFVGAYSFYTLTSPFVWLACCFSVKSIMWGILLAFYLKMLCIAAFSYLYFKTMRFGSELCILGALLYTFSSFTVANLFYFHFCEPIMMFPLLLIAIENVIKKKKHCLFWLALASFGVVWINFYFALGSFMLGLFYFLFRARGLRLLSWPLLLEGVSAVLVGVLMSSVILLPVILHHAGADRLDNDGSMARMMGLTSFDGFSLIVRILPVISSFIIPHISEGFSDFFKNGSLIRSNECFIAVFGILPAYIYIYMQIKELAVVGSRFARSVLPHSSQWNLHAIH